MFFLTLVGGVFCHLLYGPFLREAGRACDALEKKCENG